MKQTLPAIDVEVPRMGMIVYISPRIGTQEGKSTAMFTAEIPVDGVLELQSFHLKCDSRKEAEEKRDEMSANLTKGPFPFIQTKI